MARSALDICFQAHDLARKRNRHDHVFGLITADQMRDRAVRIQRAFEVRRRHVVALDCMSDNRKHLMGTIDLVRILNGARL